MSIAEHNRRRALGLVAGLGITASSLFVAGCSKAGDQAGEEKPESGEGEVTANEDLMREHGVLRRILAAFRETASKLVANPASVDAKAIAAPTPGSA